MKNDTAKVPGEMQAWDRLAATGITNAMVGLSQTVGREVKANSINVKHVLAKNMPDVLGGRDAPVVGIYLTFAGAAEGHIMIVNRSEAAYAMSGILTGSNSDISKSSGEMEHLALSEMGNTMGATFLSTVTDTKNLTFRLSPPAVLLDSARAILDIALAEILQEHDDILVVETILGASERTVPGTFLIMSPPGFLQLLAGDSEKLN
jgi:chemotaxis protein CheC